jgi:methionyl-tRNA formyltransferase
VWSVINGDEELGSTIFQITPEMDAGDYVAQIRVKNQENASIGEIMQQVESKVLIELLKNWEELKTGQVKVYAQDLSKITLARKRTDADGRIQWNDTAQQVHNFVRAQSKPYPGAYFILQESEFRVYESEVADISQAITPGVVLKIDKSKLRVSCGMGTAINFPLGSIESLNGSDVNELRVGLSLN